MRHLLFFLFALLFTAAVFSQNVDTITNYQFVNGNWQIASRDVIRYDASCRAYATLSQLWQTSSSSWTDSLLTTYTYNSNNLPDSVLFRVWRNDAWQDSTLTLNYYNADNLVDSIIVETWNDTSWIRFGSTNFVYNADKTINYIEYDGLPRSYYIEYTYDATPLKRLLYRDSLVAYTFHCPPTTLFYRRREIFTYDSLNAPVTVTEFDRKWIISGPPFSNPCLGHYYTISAGQINYTYNSDGTLKEITIQGPDGDNLTKTTFHYTPPCLLPLTLLRFTAALDGKAAQLQWATATEIDTKNFIIQRSIDAMHFQNIGSVNAVGNSTQITSYSFADADAFNVGANKLYYRLQMVDKDGKFTYSNIATVQIVNGKLFVIYPNPVKDDLFITSNASMNNAQIRISDPGGRVVYQQQISNAQPGITKINVSGFGKGVYYLQLITGSDAQTTKFMKY
jgi:hypothetical protein